MDRVVFLGHIVLDIVRSLRFVTVSRLYFRRHNRSCCNFGETDVASNRPKRCKDRRALRSRLPRASERYFHGCTRHAQRCRVDCGSIDDRYPNAQDAPSRSRSSHESHLQRVEWLQMLSCSVGSSLPVPNEAMLHEDRYVFRDEQSSTKWPAKSNTVPFANCLYGRANEG